MRARHASRARTPRQAADARAAARRSYDFQVSCPQTGQTVSLTDVVFGEVFLCGGQSNMQMTVGQAFNASQEESAANDYPFIRLFTVGQGNVSSAPLQTLAVSARAFARCARCAWL